MTNVVPLPWRRTHQCGFQLLSDGILSNLIGSRATGCLLLVLDQSVRPTMITLILVDLPMPRYSDLPEQRDNVCTTVKCGGGHTERCAEECLLLNSAASGNVL